jgi:hypothetical protein
MVKKSKDKDDWYLIGKPVQRHDAIGIVLFFHKVIPPALETYIAHFMENFWITLMYRDLRIREII